MEVLSDCHEYENSGFAQACDRLDEDHGKAEAEVAGKVAPLQGVARLSGATAHEIERMWVTMLRQIRYLCMLFERKAPSVYVFGQALPDRAWPRPGAC